MPRYSFAHGVDGCLEMCPTPDYVKRLTSMITQAVPLASWRLESASSIVGARAAGWHRRIGSPMGGRVGSSVGPSPVPRLVDGCNRQSNCVAERPVTPAGATSAGIGGDAFGLYPLSIQWQCPWIRKAFEAIDSRDDYSPTRESALLL